MAYDALVLAGGLGTRIRPVTGGLIPKALVPVLGRPFIDYKLRSLVKLGVKRAILLTGEGGKQILDHVGDGSMFGLSVECIPDGPQLLGTAGAIGAALHALPEYFWVTYGDSLVTADLAAAELALQSPGAEALMTVLRNQDRWEPSNVDVLDDLVVVYEQGASVGTHQWIDYGLLCFKSACFGGLPTDRPTDLRVLLDDLLAQSALRAFPVEDRFWEIGTPKGLEQTEAHFSAIGMWESLQ